MRILTKKHLAVFAALMITSALVFAVTALADGPASSSGSVEVAETESAGSLGALDGSQPSSSIAAEARMEEAAQHAGLGEVSNTESTKGVDGESIDVAATEAEGACVATPNMTTCGTLENVEAGDTLAVVSCVPSLGEGEIELVGLVPNGVSSVSVSVEGGAALEVPVSGNVVSAVVHGRPTQVQWQSGADGQETTVVVPGNRSMLSC